MGARGPAKKIHKLQQLDPESLMRMDKDERSQYIVVAVATAVGLWHFIMSDKFRQLKPKDLKEKITLNIAAIFSMQGMARLQFVYDRLTPDELFIVRTCEAVIVGGIVFWTMEHPEVISEALESGAEALGGLTTIIGGFGG